MGQSEKLGEFLNWLAASAMNLLPVLPLVAGLVLLLGLPAEGLFLYLAPPQDDPVARHSLQTWRQVWLFTFWSVGSAVLLAALRDAATGSLSLPGAMMGGLRRLPALVAANFLAGLAVAAGITLLIVPGVFLALQFSLAAPLVVAEDLGPISALKESWRRIDGLRWKVLGLLMALALVGGIWLGVSLASLLVLGKAAPVLLMAVGQGVLGAFGLSALFTLYWDEARGV